jgi:hypothetical protein
MTLFDNIPGCFLAGGAITSHATRKDINDYDIYPKNLEGLYAALEIGKEGGDILSITDRAVTFLLYEKDMKDNRIVMQVMIFDLFETADKIFEYFDFTVCMGAYDFDTNEYVYHPDFMKDNAARLLKFNPKTRYPLASLMRINKYKDRGYDIMRAEELRVIMSVLNKGLPKTWKDLAEDLGGSYGQRIIFDPETLEKECNYENIMAVLSKIHTFERREESIDISFEELVICCTHSGLYCVKLGDAVTVINDNTIVATLSSGYGIEENSIVRVKNKYGMESKQTYENRVIKQNVIDISNAYAVKTYKYVEMDADGRLYSKYSKNHLKKDFYYEVDTFAYEYNSPYIFAGAKQNSRGLKGNVLLELYTLPSMIHNLSSFEVKANTFYVNRVASKEEEAEVFKQISESKNSVMDGVCELVDIRNLPVNIIQKFQE